MRQKARNVFLILSLHLKKGGGTKYIRRKAAEECRTAVQSYTTLKKMHSIPNRDLRLSHLLLIGMELLRRAENRCIFIFIALGSGVDLQCATLRREQQRPLDVPVLQKCLRETSMVPDESHLFPGFDAAVEGFDVAVSEVGEFCCLTGRSGFLRSCAVKNDLLVL
jgi:hypothetical protein